MIIMKTEYILPLLLLCALPFDNHIQIRCYLLREKMKIKTTLLLIFAFIGIINVAFYEKYSEKLSFHSEISSWKLAINVFSVFKLDLMETGQAPKYPI